MTRVPALLLAFANLSCASYRFLPLLPESATAAPLQYEKTQLLFFHDSGETRVERLFADPVPNGPLLAIALSPLQAALASTDGGARWTAFELPLDERVTPHLLREVRFDPVDPKQLYARTFNGVLGSRDGGQTFHPLAFNPDTKPRYGDKPRSIDAFALGPDSTLYVAQGSALYASSDRGATFMQLPFEMSSTAASNKSGATTPAPSTLSPRTRIRSILADPAQRNTIYVSVETEPSAESFPRRLMLLIDGAPGESQDVRALFALPTDHPLERISFGDIRAGVYVTRDGGHRWEKTGLGIDSWLVAHDGAILGVAADSLLVAQGLVERAPGFAQLISAQLHDTRADPELLRRDCAFPGREKLLAQLPSSLIFRSTDEGKSWSHLSDPDLLLAIALRNSVDAQRTARDPWPPRGEPQSSVPEEREFSKSSSLSPMDSAGHGGHGGGGRGGGHKGTTRNAAEEITAEPDLTEPLLALLDPTLMLSRLGFNLPLTGVSNSSGQLWAYVPTADYWDELVAGLITGTRAQGELTQGGPTTLPSKGPGFELIHSENSGQTWNALPASLDARQLLRSYPAGVVSGSSQAFFLISDQSPFDWPRSELLVVHAPAAAQ